MGPSRQFANHPDPMDLWLESQGYYRKITARDGSSLFRSIAEQVFNTQRYHLEVRKQCVEYLTSHPEILQESEMEESIDVYLEHMQSPTQWGGPAEITAMSHLYKINILVFKEVGVHPQLDKSDEYEKTIMLCTSQDHHYDPVYPKEYTKIAGFCQSLVYEVLYQNVFMMKDVDYAVDKMLHYKPLRHRNDLGVCSPRKFYSFNSSLQYQRKGVIEELLDSEINVRELLSKGITPFPYKVAKSLDPNIFRNVEFDVWIDYRRGLRLGYFGSNSELRVGVKCLVKLTDENSYVGHIQEMAPDKGPVVLFVEEFGEKRTVPYECLEVLPQEQSTNKTWPTTFQNQRFNSSSPLKQTPSSESGNKPRKGRESGDHKTSVSNSKSSQGGGVRSRSRKPSQSNTNFENGELNNSTISQPGVSMMAYTTASSEGYLPYQGYQVEAEMGIPVMVDRGLQYPLLPQTPVSPIPGHAPILLPLSPTPEDMTYRYAPFTFPTDNKESSLGTQGTTTAMHPTDYFQFVSDNPTPLPDVPEHATVDETTPKTNCSTNYSTEVPKPQLQINFNAPKSVLDSGADLPMSDIQTLRFFYNLGNDIYQAQCCAWNNGPCSATVCNSGCTPACATANTTSACTGKCNYTSSVENPIQVQDTTSTSSGIRRKRRDTSASSPGGVSMSSESDAGDGCRGNPLQQSAVQPPHTPPRLKKDGKPGKSKPKENKGEEGGGSRVNIAQTSTSLSSKRTGDQSTHLEPLILTDISAKETGDAVVPAMALQCGYVCYPNSPVLPFSPVDSETGMPLFPSCRVQYSDYMADNRQQCFSPLADASTYANSPQYSMYAPSSHIIFPASPGIYVGAAPSWTTMAPPTPQ